LAIKSFTHKGLKKFFYKDDTSGLALHHVKTIGFILDAIDSSHHPVDLKVIYQIDSDGAILLDYRDYHGKNIKAK